MDARDAVGGSLIVRRVQLPGWMRPSRSVPVTRWRSERRWTSRPSTLAVLVLGLFVFGVGDGLLVLADLGVSPWTVLAQGVAVRASIPIGVSTLIVSVAVLLLWIPLRERPGLGTIANILVIAGALQLVVSLVPHPEHPVARVALVLGGIALIGLGSGFYLTCNLGPGPRDGWMTGIHHRTGIPVARVRLTIEVAVLALGWLLGGTVGIGTLAFALLIGPSVAYGLRIAGRVGRVPGAPPRTAAEESAPELDA